MPGITRIKIKSDWSDWRTKMSDDLTPAADEIYRDIFNLMAETEFVTTTKDEAISRYDWKEGIDVILRFQDGTKATLQEKYLDYKYNTITFEEQKTSGEPGAWYYCTAQYYFVGYARQYREHNIRSFQSYMMIDLPGLHRFDQTTQLRWYRNRNGRDGRASTFRFIYFNDVPKNLVIASKASDMPELFLRESY